MFYITDTHKQTTKTKPVLYVTFPPTLVNDFYQKTDMRTGPCIFLVFSKSGIYLPVLQVVLPLKHTPGRKRGAPREPLPLLTPPASPLQAAST